MNKKLVIGALAGCAIAAAIAVSKKKQTEPKPTMWDKMRQHMEEMPEDFPPRIMFDNLEVTRANTEKILERLDEKESSKDYIDVVHNP